MKLKLMIGWLGWVSVLTGTANWAYADSAAPSSNASNANIVVATAATPSVAKKDQAISSQAQGGANHSKSMPLAQSNMPLNEVQRDEKVMENNPPLHLSSQAQSKGLIADSHLDFEFRNYADIQHVDSSGLSPSLNRHAWIQGVQANFTSGFTQGLLGLGFDASLFGALKLDGGNGAGNMAHVDRNGGGNRQLAWAYPGMYDIKGRISNTVLKYGLQIIDDNPYLEPHDNRSLPPTFLGASLVSNDLKNVVLQGGSFTKVNARGTTFLADLTTQYGGVAFKRLSYVGGIWNYSDNGSASLFVDQADDVWRQYFASVQHSIGDINTIKWTGYGNLYSTHSAGSANQGHINSNAYSLSLTAQHGPHGVLVGYQKILGDQFFDYVNETNGIYLVNSMDVDYNAPHEQSLQLRYMFDGKYAGLPGFKVMTWGVMGWGADAAAVANQYGSNGPGFSSIYWKNGQPVHGSHHEFGIVPSYTLQSGRFKNTNITLTAMWHRSSEFYSDSSNYEYRLMVKVPVNMF